MTCLNFQKSAFLEESESHHQLFLQELSYIETLRCHVFRHPRRFQEGVGRLTHNCTCRWSRCTLLLSTPPTFTDALFLADRMRGSRALKTRQTRQLWCGALPEQKSSTIDAQLHLQVVSPANTLFKNPQATRFLKSAILYSEI